MTLISDKNFILKRFNMLIVKVIQNRYQYVQHNDQR